MYLRSNGERAVHGHTSLLYSRRIALGDMPLMTFHRCSSHGETMKMTVVHPIALLRFLITHGRGTMENFPSGSLMIASACIWYVAQKPGPRRRSTSALCEVYIHSHQRRMCSGALVGCDDDGWTPGDRRQVCYFRPRILWECAS